MNREIVVDVAVVGLGAMGAAALYQLATQGIQALGIDRFHPPHDLGSTHGETRATRLGVGEGAAYFPFVSKSHEIWRALEAQTGEALLFESGALILSAEGAKTSHHGKEDFVTRSLTTARCFNIKHEMLGANEIRHRFPHLSAIGDDTRGYYEPGAGYLSVEKCVTTQLRLAKKLGAEILLNEPVISIRQVGEHVEIERPSGRIRAQRAIVAAGAWLGPLLGKPFDDLLSVKRQVLYWFKAAPDVNFGEQPPIVIWMHGPGNGDYFYGFPPKAGSSSIKFATEQYETSTTVNAVERSVSPAESQAFFDTHIRGRVNGISPILERSTVCLYTVTPDFGFIIDNPPGQDRILAISACSGHGFKHSAGIGFAASQWAGAGTSAIDLSPFRISRFSDEASFGDPCVASAEGD